MTRPTSASTPIPTTDVEELRLGLLSDTHGRADTCRLALELLLAHGAQAFVHCGDVGEEPVFDVLAGHRVWFVWGNNDFDRPRLARYAADLDLICLGDAGNFTFGGRRFFVTHGDDPRLLSRHCTAGERGEPLEGGPLEDYLLTGHTHTPHDRRCGQLRWINPGALFRARPKTIGLLHVGEDRLEMMQLDPQRGV